VYNRKLDETVVCNMRIVVMLYVKINIIITWWPNGRTTIFSESKDSHFL